MTIEILKFYFETERIKFRKKKNKKLINYVILKSWNFTITLIINFYNKISKKECNLNILGDSEFVEIYSSSF